MHIGQSVKHPDGRWKFLALVNASLDALWIALVLRLAYFEVLQKNSVFLSMRNLNLSSYRMGRGMTST